MKFNLSLSSQEKRVIYTQVRDGLEKSLIIALIGEGIDPDTFDEEAFSIETDELGRPKPGHVTIKDHLERLADVNRKLSEL